MYLRLPSYLVHTQCRTMYLGLPTYLVSPSPLGATRARGVRTVSSLGATGASSAVQHVRQRETMSVLPQ